MEENNTNQQQRQLFFNRVLDALSRDDADDGTFAACGVVDSSELGDLTSIHVEGVGDLLLPLSKADTCKLRGLCEQAPFGQGLTTVVDTTVRDCWQVDASKVTFLKAPEFLPKTIQLIAEKAVSALGLNGAWMQLEAHLYKLLLYEEDGHFKVHRDTEKEKGMFATLVLQLPTETGYEGGVLTVKHKNGMRTFDLSRVSSTGFGYTVFYGDCQHELQRITSGTRLCLAFNLIRQNMTSNVERLDPETLREISTKVEQVQKVLEPWMEEVIQGESDVYPDKLVIPLEHKYTQENLCFTGLKGGDYIITEVFRNCKDSDGEQVLDLHLCLVTKHQEGDPEPDYGNRDHYSTDARGYGPPELGEDSSDSEDESGDSEDDHAIHHTMDRVHSEEIETSNWIGMGDEAAPAFENLHIDMDKEVIVYEGEQPFYDEPDVKEYEGYTGNAGATLEYWYHRAMVVVWPKLLSVSVACKAGVSNALDLLESMLESNDMGFDDSLQEVIDYCEDNHSEVWTYSGGDAMTARLLNLCLETDELGDVTRALKLLSKASIYHSNCNNNIVKDVIWKVGIRNLDVARAIATVVCARGWESCSSIIIELVNECALSQGESFAQLAMELLGIGNMEAAVDVAKRTFEIFWTTNSQVSQLGASRICTVVKMLCFSQELQNEFGRRIVGRLKEIKTEVLTTLIIQMCPKYPSFNCRLHPTDVETFTTSTTKDEIPTIRDWFSQICEELTTRNFYYQCGPQNATTSSSGARQDVQEKSVESQIVNLVCTFLGIGNKLLFDSLIQALLDQSKLYKKNHLVKTLLDSEAIWQELSGEAFGILGLQSLANARIDEVSQHEEPIFSWCQPLAQLPSHPTVQRFFRGPQQSLTYNGLGSLPNAREFARKYLHGMYKDGFSAIGIEGGRGAKAFCEIQKTRDAFEVATREWKKEQQEVETLMHRLERLRSDVTDTNSTVTLSDPIMTSGHHDKKRKTMEHGGQ